MSLGFGNVLNNGMDSDGFDSTFIEGSHTLNNIANQHQHHIQSQMQHHHHHHADEIVMNSSSNIDDHGMLGPDRLIDRASKFENNILRASNSDITAFNLKYNGIEQQTQKLLHNSQYQQEQEQQQQPQKYPYYHHIRNLGNIQDDEGGGGTNDGTGGLINNNVIGNGNSNSGRDDTKGEISSMITCDKRTCITTTINNNNDNDGVHLSNSINNRGTDSRLRADILSDNGGDGISDGVNNNNDLRINNNNNNNINIINNNNDNEDVISEGVLSVSNAINQRIITA